MEAFISGLNPLLALFLIAALGYLIGAIKIKGIELGTAARCWWRWYSATSAILARLT